MFTIVNLPWDGTASIAVLALTSCWGSLLQNARSKGFGARLEWKQVVLEAATSSWRPETWDHYISIIWKPSGIQGIQIQAQETVSIKLCNGVALVVVFRNNWHNVCFVVCKDRTRGLLYFRWRTPVPFTTSHEDKFLKISAFFTIKDPFCWNV